MGSSGKGKAARDYLSGLVLFVFMAELFIPYVISLLQYLDEATPLSELHGFRLGSRLPR